MNALPTRSTFVTVVAWIFIVLSGFGTMIAILQNIMVQTMFQSPGMSEAMQAPPPGLPPAAEFMLSHFQWFFVAVLLVMSLMFVTSIGLLRRWNWARLCFIGLMVLGIAWQVVGLVIQATMVSSMKDEFAAATAQGAPDMGPIFLAMAIFGVLLALAISLLFGWIAKRLLSAPVAAEFRRQAPSGAGPVG